MKTVAIVGSGVPFQTEKYNEVWANNNAYLSFAFRQLNKLFIMHKQHKKRGELVYDWGDIAIKAKQNGFQVITLHDILELPDRVAYPYEEIVRMFDTDYFASTICYQIAYALYQGFSTIGFYNLGHFSGVSDETDDLNERCGEEYWIGRASQLASVYVDKTCDYLTTTTGLPYAIKG